MGFSKQTVMQTRCQPRLSLMPNLNILTATGVLCRSEHKALCIFEDASMRSRTTTSILPPHWILLILWVLCSSMLWRAEPASLDTLSSPSSKTPYVQTAEARQDMPAVLAQKWHAPERLESLPPSFSFCLPKAPLPLPAQAALWIWQKAAPLPSPAVWDGYSHPSRSPPALG